MRYCFFSGIHIWKTIIYATLVSICITAILYYFIRSIQDLSEEASIPPLYPNIMWKRSENYYRGNLARSHNIPIRKVIYTALALEHKKRQEASNVKQYYEYELTKRGWHLYPNKYIVDDKSFAVEYVKPEYPFLCPMHFVLQELLPCIGNVKVFHIFFNDYQDTNVQLEISFTKT